MTENIYPQLSAARPFSVFKREEILNTLGSGRFDLLVLGGGITGAGIALDAASRGLKVALIEKADFASGTSSRSTKLIHGGLRYLKQGEVGLVREVGTERAVIHKNAPHLVLPEKMLLPIFKGGSFGLWSSSLGIWLYDRIAGVQKPERRIMLSKRQTLEREPLLATEGLKGAALFYEYRTDDARLTIEVLKTANAFGAVCLNYLEAEEFTYDGDRLKGIKARDIPGGRIVEISARRVINATGPWVDEIRSRDKAFSAHGKKLFLSKGVHIVVPHSVFPLRQSVYYDAPGGRMIMSIPRENTTYVGTTDTAFKEDLNQPRITREDAQYLLSAVNQAFPSVRLKQEQISSGWAGVRPLILQEGKQPSEMSRRDEIFISNSGLISIAGGKLTGFRKMAQRVVDLIMQEVVSEQPVPFRACQTGEIVLSGGNLGEPLENFVEHRWEQARELGLTREDVGKLAGKYGSNLTEVLKKIPPRSPDLQLNLLFAELDYCLESEMATNMNDFLVRRTAKLLFERETLAELYPKILDRMSKRFGWTADQRKLQLETFEEQYSAVTRFS